MQTTHVSCAAGDSYIRSLAAPLGIATRWARLVCAMAIITLVLSVPGSGLAADTNLSSDDAGIGGPALSEQEDRKSVAKPDKIAEYVGGVAAHLRIHDGDKIPGTLIFLLAKPGSEAKARSYEDTPYRRTTPEMHPEAVESNDLAVATVEDIVGVAPIELDFTSAPDGGPSGGLTYAIAYLNVLSGGAFTGELSVAITGRLEKNGYVHPINGVNEKVAAAHLAQADILFTPSIPSADLLDAYASRSVGELFRARNTGATIQDERRWVNYSAWGADRPSDGMDVVGVRHIGDVAAYLCGAASDYGCEIQQLLEDGSDLRL